MTRLFRHGSWTRGQFDGGTGPEIVVERSGRRRRRKGIRTSGGVGRERVCVLRRISIRKRDVFQNTVSSSYYQDLGVKSNGTWTMRETILAMLKGYKMDHPAVITLQQKERTPKRRKRDLFPAVIKSVYLCIGAAHDGTRGAGTMNSSMYGIVRCVGVSNGVRYIQLYVRLFRTWMIWEASCLQRIVGSVPLCRPAARMASELRAVQAWPIAVPQRGKFWKPLESGWMRNPSVSPTMKAEG